MELLNGSSMEEEDRMVWVREEVTTKQVERSLERGRLRAKGGGQRTEGARL